MLTSDASIVKTPATEFVPSELRRPVYECETAPSASMLSLEKPVVDQDPVMFGSKSEHHGQFFERLQRFCDDVHGGVWTP